MRGVLAPLSTAMKLILAQPKLFIPKFFLAFVWGSLMLYSLDLLSRAASLSGVPPELLSGTGLQGMIFEAEIFAAAFVIAFLLDTFINSLYPELSKQYRSRESISFSGAFRSAKPKLGGIFSAIIASTVISFLILTPFSIAFGFALFSGNLLWIALSSIILAIVALLISGIFYLVNPIAVLEGKGIAAISKSFSMGKRIAPAVSAAVLVSFVLSLISAFAALSFGGIGWLGFILARVLTSIVATYQIALNPEVYLENRQKALGERK